jgi:hypothetical protein
MNRASAAAAVALGAAALTLGIAAPAQASATDAPAPLVIHEQIDFASNTFRFTAAAPLCPSGSWVDDVTDAHAINAQQTVFSVTIDSVYTCDDGSGTFYGHKVLVLHTFADGSESSTGRIRISGGTGAYSDIRAVGTDNGGANAEGIGTGVIHGALQRL